MTEVRLKFLKEYAELITQKLFLFGGKSMTKMKAIDEIRNKAVKLYEGMVVGYSPKQEDLVVNVCKKKHVTNMRASGSDEALRLTPPSRLSLEESLEFLAEDELLEVTPESLRIRKAILNNQLRAKQKFQKK